jgi:hypothetical protein
VFFGRPTFRHFRNLGRRVVADDLAVASTFRARAFAACVEESFADFPAVFRASRGALAFLRGRARRYRKSSQQVRRFLAAHGMIYDHFRPRRHLRTAGDYWPKELQDPAARDVCPNADLISRSSMAWPKRGHLSVTLAMPSGHKATVDRLLEKLPHRVTTNFNRLKQTPGPTTLKTIRMSMRPANPEQHHLKQFVAAAHAGPMQQAEQQRVPLSRPGDVQKIVHFQARGFRGELTSGSNS